jgi:DNA-binding GntR family transcriptional regulator
MVALMVERDQPRFDPRGMELVYVQLADDVAAAIDRGDYQPGDRLPSEGELADRYGCARMTARRAIRELRDRGLVRTVAGKGSYVLGRQS